MKASKVVIMGAGRTLKGDEVGKRKKCIRKHAEKRFDTFIYNILCILGMALQVYEHGLPFDVSHFP